MTESIEVNRIVQSAYANVLAHRAGFGNPYQPHKLELLATETLAIVDRCLGLIAEVNQLNELQARFELDQLLLDLEIATADDEAALTGTRKSKEDEITKILTESTPEQVGVYPPEEIAGGLKNQTLLRWHNVNVWHAYKIRDGDDGNNLNKNATTFGGWLSTGQAVVAGVEHVVRQRLSVASATELGSRSTSHERRKTGLEGVKDERAKYAKDFSALDFRSRVNAIVDNLLMPYLLDAHQRCLAIAEGVALVHNYRSAGEVPHPSERSIYELAGWLRNVLTMLAQKAQGDQGASIVLSLKSVTKSAHIAPGVHRFTLDKESFLPFENVRLRGISATALTTSSNAVFSARVRPPQLAVGCPNSSDPYGCITVDQTGVAGCRIGKILPITAAGSPELAGTVTLFNVRPVSQPAQGPRAQWLVDLTQIAGESDTLTDLLLELRVVGVPVRS